MTWPEIRSPSSAKCRGTSRIDSSNDIRLAGTFRPGSLLWLVAAAAPCTAVWVMSHASRSADAIHVRLIERFHQILYSMKGAPS